MKIKFDLYHNYEEMVKILKGFADEYPKLCNLYSMGKSTAGRELYVMEITNSETGLAADKPAIYEDGVEHGAEVTGREVCLWTINYVLTNYGKDDFITGLLDTRCLYIQPCLNPDGAEIYLTTPYRRIGGGILNPEFEWKEGLYEEDVNSDGHITQMRVEDPNGDWKVSDKDSRCMVKRKVNDFGGRYYKIYTEGHIKGYDGGEIKMRPQRYIGGTNRNWPGRWTPEKRAYGVDMPLDEPEPRANADFWKAHKNICGGLCYHTYSGIIVRSLSNASDDTLDVRDIATYQFIGEIGTDLTGELRYPFIGGNNALFTMDPANPRMGTGKDFWFDVMGTYAFTIELWDLAGNAGLGNFQERGGIKFLRDGNRTEEEDLAMLKWNDKELDGDGFVDWTPYEHPDLGPVEIGGWKFKFTWQNAPPKFLEEECERTGKFMLVYAALTPLIKLKKVETKCVGPGLHKISVVVKNVGFLPTNITEHAKKANIAKPVVIKIIPGEGAELVMGKEIFELGHIEGRSDRLPGRFYTPLGPREEPPGRFYGDTFGGRAGGAADSSSRAVEWLVKVPSDIQTMVMIEVTSEKGGIDRKEIVLKP